MYHVVEGFYWQRRKRQHIEKRQMKILRQVLNRSYGRVPFYRGNQAYATPIHSLRDMEKLPMISKKQLQQNGIEAFRDPLYLEDGKAIQCITSGSTGEPTKIYHDRGCFDYHTAVGVRRVLATGKYKPTYRLLHIRPVPMKKRLFEYIGLFRRDIIPASLPIEAIKDIILKVKPDGLVAYPVYLRDLIASLSSGELDTIRTHLKIIFSESEMLTQSHRAFIESSFGVEIFDDYSAYETLSITFECAYHRHHVVEDRLYLEIVNDEGIPVRDGEEGNIVMTSFMEKAMPLIRYSIGDRGILNNSPCPCGRTFKTLKLTQGRTEDYIMLDNGEKIYSATILHMAAQLKGVREVYVYQAASGDVTIYYVPLEDRVEDQEITDFINSYFSQHASVPCSIHVCRSNAIPRTQGGKARLIYSELANSPAPMGLTAQS